jgi:hypothetical protein
MKLCGQHLKVASLLARPPCCRFPARTSICSCYCFSCSRTVIFQLFFIFWFQVFLRLKKKSLLRGPWSRQATNYAKARPGITGPHAIIKHTSAGTTVGPGTMAFAHTDYQSSIFLSCSSPFIHASPAILYMEERQWSWLSRESRYNQAQRRNVLFSCSTRIQKSCTLSHHSCNQCIYHPILIGYFCSAHPLSLWIPFCFFRFRMRRIRRVRTCKKRRIPLFHDESLVHI